MTPVRKTARANEHTEPEPDLAQVWEGPVTSVIEEFQLEPDCIWVRWTGGAESRFHHIWLRDNCPQGLHPVTWERIQDVMDLDPDLCPASVKLTDAGGLTVSWTDVYTSHYGADWLHRRRYDATARAERRLRPSLWGAAIADTLPEAQFAEIATDDAALLAWLRQVRNFGFALVRQMPDDERAGEQVAERISFLRQTNFGTGFDVISKPNPNNIAYTAIELKAHTDLPNREMPPGIQFLHCLDFQATGGDSLLVDGFHAAETLRAEDADAFAILASTAIPFRFHDREWDIRWSGPPIELDADGHVRGIRYHMALTAPLDVPADRVVPVYRALRAFTQILRRPAMELRIRLRPGDMLAFDNRRSLHGRAAFDPNSGSRRLHGCYVDIDEFMSRIRVLEGENLLH
jgi:gamma-butyrobetaine dioxygenase